MTSAASRSENAQSVRSLSDSIANDRRLPVLPIHAQHRTQQHNRFQQIVVMDNPPLAAVVAGIERSAAVSVSILGPPGRAVDLAD